MYELANTRILKTLLTKEYIDKFQEMGTGYEIKLLINLGELFDLETDPNSLFPYKDTILKLSEKKDELIPDFVLEVFQALNYAHISYLKSSSIKYWEYLPDVSVIEWFKAIDTLEKFGLIEFIQYGESERTYPQIKSKMVNSNEKRKKEIFQELIHNLLPYLAETYLKNYS